MRHALIAYFILLYTYIIQDVCGAPACVLCVVHVKEDNSFSHRILSLASGLHDKALLAKPSCRPWVILKGESSEVGEAQQGNISYAIYYQFELGLSK